jgi:thymidylate synthase (FAD)
MNARELRHFFELRLDVSAQAEIRELAKKMLTEVKKVTKVLFNDLYVHEKDMIDSNN